MDTTNVTRNVHHDSDTSSDDSFVMDESEDELNSKLQSNINVITFNVDCKTQISATTYFHDNITEDPSDDKPEDNLIEVPMELDSCSVVDASAISANTVVAEAPKDCLIEMPMELDLNCLTETRKSHVIACPVCFEISVLSKQSKLYENIIAACMKKNSKI